MSSAESFYLMFAQCPQVTTMGDRTAGSSANPRRIDAGSGITVNLPRWLDLLPNGNRLDTVGVSPDVRVEAGPGEFFNESDPVLEAALKRLRALPEAERQPGWRSSAVGVTEEGAAP
jgi:C-terminal processing protease CtpA/Prc